MKILGIDPGLSSTGIGIVSGLHNRITDYSFGVIDTPCKTSNGDRLNIIFSETKKILTSQKPDIVIIEDIFSLNKYPKSGILLGKVTGVLLLACAISKITVIEITVKEAKQILTGNGRADKAQLETAVRNLLNSTALIKPCHASDALALALIGLFRYSNRLLSSFRQAQREEIS
ncbi:MAG: crossover junction endodeoxyribonuclease RuvC [Deltaproteobacteria bacterium]|nr:crossover junction endodeoxyribonuclease RuvC [Deltaproteobacteria bacterium]